VATNLDRFRKDLNELIEKGNRLEIAIQYECMRSETRAALEMKLGDKTDEFLKKLPLFNQAYQLWYSEALALLQQLLPDRVADFVRHYEKPKGVRTSRLRTTALRTIFKGFLSRVAIPKKPS